MYILSCVQAHCSSWIDIYIYMYMSIRKSYSKLLLIINWDQLRHGQSNGYWALSLSIGMVNYLQLNSKFNRKSFYFFFQLYMKIYLRSKNSDENEWIILSNRFSNAQDFHEHRAWPMRRWMVTDNQPEAMGSSVMEKHVAGCRLIKREWPEGGSEDWNAEYAAELDPSKARGRIHSRNCACDLTF